MYEMFVYAISMAVGAVGIALFLAFINIFVPIPSIPENESLGIRVFYFLFGIGIEFFLICSFYALGENLRGQFGLFSLITLIGLVLAIIGIVLGTVTEPTNS